PGGTSMQVPPGSKLWLVIHRLRSPFTGGWLTITLRLASGVAASADDAVTTVTVVANTHTRATIRLAVTGPHRRTIPSMTHPVSRVPRAQKPPFGTIRRSIQPFLQREVYV